MKNKIVLEEHFATTDTIGDSQEYFPAQIWPERQEIGTDRVLFSIDYPFESMEEGATWFDAAEIGENDRDNIGRRNAARLFNLPNNL